ncbi:MAG: exodeoxyribonuclease VII small subunit [Myxococcota bacterium]
MKPEAETHPFEELVRQLEAIVDRLEREDLPLEEALEAYQEGVRLARLGHHRLDDAERRLEQLSSQGKLVPQDSDAVLPEGED